MTISLNPMPTTNAAGLFDTSSQGLTQGDAQADPAIKFALVGGYLNPSASAPIWGGLPIEEYLTVDTTGNSVLGNKVDLATANANITGFAVFNQAFAGITTPQSPVPTYQPGQSVNYYRLGSGACIPLPIDPALVSLAGDFVNQQVSWDFTANQIIAYSSGVGALNVKILKIVTQNNLRVSYSGGNATYGSGALALCQI